MDLVWLYKQTASELNYQLRFTDFDVTPSFSDMFDSSSGVLKIDQDDPGGSNQAWDNFSQTTVTRNIKTKATAFNYVWQAGTGDRNSRMFNLWTTLSGSTHSGLAYYGFAEKFDSVGGTGPTGGIEGFYCSWAGPGNSGSFDKSGYSQKQVIQTNSSGIFEATESKITYAQLSHVICPLKKKIQTLTTQTQIKNFGTGLVMSMILRVVRVIGMLQIMLNRP